MPRLLPQAPFPHDSILNITPYVGGDITPPGMVRRIALASNENPLGPSPSVFPILQDALNRAHLYPSGGASALKRALADQHSLDPDRILCGNGSEDILHLLARTYAGPGDEVIFPQYGFMVYKIATLSVQATPIPFPQPHLIPTVEAILKAISPHTKMIFLDHPGNPLGTYLSRNDLHRLHDHIPPHILLVIDAAYAEYLQDVTDYTAGLELAKASSNIVVVRTFSKIYGLAGLRVGWTYAPYDIIQTVNRIRPPFNVNHFGQMATIAALKDQAWVNQCHRYVQNQRPWVVQKFTDLGLEVHPGYSNFILLKFPETGPKTAARAYQYLGEHGIIVRPVASYGLPHHLRITIGRQTEMEELTELLTKFIKEKDER